MKLSLWVKNARTFSGLTQTELASQLKSPPTKAAVSAWEQGRSTPSLAVIEDIARATDYPLPWEDGPSLDDVPLKIPKLIAQLAAALSKAPTRNQVMLIAGLTHLVNQPSAADSVMGLLVGMMTPDPEGGVQAANDAVPVLSMETEGFAGKPPLLPAPDNPTRVKPAIRAVKKPDFL
jgi:transcriptional regulator with XRE-family HTH domain